MEPVLDAVIVSSLNSGTESIQVYDGATGTQLKSYRGQPASASTFCSVGPAAYLMTAQRDKPFLQAWAIHQHDALQIRLVVPGRVNAMAVNPAGPKYCVIGIAEKIYVYKLLSGRLIGIASRHYQPITRLVFSPCGNYFASGGEDGFVYLWNLASFIENLHKLHPPQAQPHFILGQHSDKVTDLAITSSGMRGFLVSSSLDHTARVFDLVTGRPVYNLVTASEVTSVSSNSLGSQLFLGHANGSVNIADLLPAPPHGDVEVSHQGVSCHQKCVRHLAVTPCGNHLVTGGDDGDVKVWKITRTSLDTTGAGSSRRSHLALERTVHTGRGPITNLAIKQLNREVLTTADVNTKEVIAPFSQDHSNALNAPVTVPIKGRGKQHLQLMDLFNSAIEVSETQSCYSEETSESDGDTQNYVGQLQMANIQLYKFALRNIISKSE